MRFEWASLASRCGLPLLGSASPDLQRQGSETLAGRIANFELAGSSVEEVGSGEAANTVRRYLDLLVFKGGKRPGCEVRRSTDLQEA